MLSLLWPTTKKPEPTLLGRLGRVMHWVLTASAVLAALVGLLMLSQAHSAYECLSPADVCETARWWASRLRTMATQALLAAAAVFLIGRATRYVLSAE